LLTGASRNGLPTPGKVDIEVVIDMLFSLSGVLVRLQRVPDRLRYEVKPNAWTNIPQQVPVLMRLLVPIGCGAW
jgi:hypothetical protein